MAAPLSATGLPSPSTSPTADLTSSSLFQRWPRGAFRGDASDRLGVPATINWDYRHVSGRGLMWNSTIPSTALGEPQQRKSHLHQLARSLGVT